MRIFVTQIIFLLFTLNIFSQSNELDCGTDSPSEKWEEVLQGLIHQSTLKNNQSQLAVSNYVIPVIFHIINGGEPIGTYPNIFQDQIISQLTILNQDFSGNAYNSSDYPLTAFVNWAINQNIPSANLDQNGRIKIADFNIQFCLATKDTIENLLIEPGIDRINYNNKGWQNPNLFTTQSSMKSYLDSIIKPQSIWDVRKYLNVWITDKSSLLNYAGVSSVPPLSGIMDLPNNTTDSTDGIWCYTKAVGSYTLFPNGSYISPFIDGRTLTHEVGHYLGLRHIWGDTSCGNDFCNDTPPASDQNTGTPSYPHNPGTCTSPSNNPDGEMFMNFMDYTRGPSKYLFTTNQRTRAQTVMQNSPFRNQLGTHQICSSINNLHEFADKSKMQVYPNPTFDDVNIISNNQSILKIKIFNQAGILLKEDCLNSFTIKNLNPGAYVLEIETETKKQFFKIIKIGN